MHWSWIIFRWIAIHKVNGKNAVIEESGYKLTIFRVELKDLGYLSTIKGFITMVTSGFTVPPPMSSIYLSNHWFSEGQVSPP